MNAYSLMADVVVLAHLAYVLFVILGLLAILLGYLAGWNWIRNKWFRLIHLSMIAVVVVESLLRIACPLTTLEDFLRVRAGQDAVNGSFIGRLAHDLLFVDLPPQFFTIAYCIFGGLVLVTFFLVPPRFRRA